MSCEVCLLTRSYYEDDLKEWIRWYIDILKFDHLRIFDNESTIDIKSIVANDNRITVESISGWPNQVALYQKAYDECKYDWIYFADSDEFLWFDFNEYKDVNKFIETKFIFYRLPNLAVWWKLVGSETPPEHHETTPVREYLLFQGNAKDSMCKCFYKIKGNFKWKRIFVHLPEPGMYTADISGRLIHSSALMEPEIIDKQDACIYHYYHRSYDEWKLKQVQQNPTRPGVNYNTMVPQANTYQEYLEIVKKNEYNKPALKVFNKLYPNE